MEKIKKVKYSSNLIKKEISLTNKPTLISIEELEKFLLKMKTENFSNVEIKKEQIFTNCGQFIKSKFYSLRGFTETIESDEDFEIREAQFRQEEIFKKEKQEQANLKRKMTMLKKLQKELNIQS